jgi:hypothetical protein
VKFFLFFAYLELLSKRKRSAFLGETSDFFGEVEETYSEGGISTT